MRKLFPLFAVSILTALEFTGCGGGGGGGGSSIDTNACSLIGAQAKIINGTECTDATAPVVEVFVQEPTETQLCSGVLVSPTKVLTAAHCLIGLNVQRIDVTRGSNTVRVANSAIHPEAQLTTSAFFNDVAVLTLSSSLSGTVVPVLTSRALHAGEELAIYGYGKDNNGEIKKLRSGRMVLDSVSDNHLEATYDGDGSDPCFGDSGGPILGLVKDGEKGNAALVGLVSSGTSDSCSASDTNLLTKVSSPKVLQFITDQVPDLRTE